jgi:hypothetical protein
MARLKQKRRQLKAAQKEVRETCAWAVDVFEMNKIMEDEKIVTSSESGGSGGESETDFGSARSAGSVGATSGRIKKSSRRHGTSRRSGRSSRRSSASARSRDGLGSARALSSRRERRLNTSVGVGGRANRLEG